MNVLSLFDGMSCGQIALERAGIKVDNYYASEIDKYAMKVTQANYPRTVQIGDVTQVNGFMLEFIHGARNIDLLIGGGPCQGFSIAGGQLDFNDPRSKLFFEYVRILRELKTKNPEIKFLMENVGSMKKWCIDVISKYLCVQPIKINSRLVSGQNRNRLYWTNISNITDLKDKNISLRSILFKNPGPELNHTEKAIEYMNRIGSTGRKKWDYWFHSDVSKGKSSCLVANLFKGVPNNVLVDGDIVRKFHPIECERLQTIPDDYTNYVSNTQRYKMIGNGWTVDVIAHIFKGLK